MLHLKLFIWLLLLCSYTVNAKGTPNSEYDNLFALELHELLKVEVVTASKKAEPLVSAPSIISVVTAEDIRTFGGRNIKDVLQRLPNLYIFDSTTFTATGVSLRGGATQHLNNHVLYLINGRPLRESQNGGLHTDINLLLPLESIERIELIRGPGSVLYGSNAFSGTLNFITKKANKSSQVELAVSTGSAQYQSFYGALYQPIGNDGSINLMVNAKQTDGFKQMFIDERGDMGNKYSYYDGQNISLNADYKGFSVLAFKNEIDVPIVSGAFWWDNLTEVTQERSYYDLAYQFNFNSLWSIALNHTYNKSKRFIAEGARPASMFISDGYLYEAVIEGEISDRVKFISGLVNETIKGDLGSSGGKYKSSRYMLYGQFDYNFSQDTKITAGLQWNDTDEAASNTSPRLGLIHRINQRWSSKILYSEAYRSPYGSELFFDANFLKGDQSLLPETIKTIEAQANYSGDTTIFSTTLFRSVTTDAIGRARVNNVNTFINEQGDITFSGAELEMSWDVGNDWRIQSSMVFQTNENDTGEKDVMPAYGFMTKAGISNSSNNTYRLGVWYSYFANAGKSEDINPNTIVVNKPADSLGLLSINLEFDLAELTQSNKFKNSHLSFYINNLLNESAYFPETGRKLVNTIPQAHDRGLYANFHISF